jgi:hypothetical protein
MRLDRVNEGSFYDVEASFRDSANSATIPASIRYRIDCETTGKEIRGWTEVTPAQTVTITVTAADNVLQSQGNRTEEKVMTVQTDSGTDRQYTAAYKWVVVNLRGVK